MAGTATEYKHIELDEQGTARVAGTRSRVIDLVMEQRALGLDPSEIQHQHPHLSLAQIHAALAYYWDHQDTLDADIARRTQHADVLQQRTSSSALTERLKRAKEDQADEDA